VATAGTRTVGVHEEPPCSVRQFVLQRGSTRASRIGTGQTSEDALLEKIAAAARAMVAK